MKKFLLLSLCIGMLTGCSEKTPEPCGPVPTPLQLQWQEMETYAFLHFSLNTYTDQEWGYGNEDPALFNPTKLDAEQWVKVCKEAGMKGIILTAKHHCGFCLWPSEYTEYSVKNAPWKDGQGDVVKELSEACKKYGLKFAVYLSPWDRNYPEYGRPEYIEYFRNQLRELLTNYGDMFEVWFDGANGGTGWYGGADETRTIDKKTYYDWYNTFNLIRELQPGIVIWNDGGRRGDLRWVGTEAGYVGQPNWSLLNADGDVTLEELNHGIEDGNRWVPAEVNTSIRPGWFYHPREDNQVKSVAKLMDTYYKSIGRNGTLLLNFPIRPDGLIDRRDSVTAAAFGQYVQELFANDLAADADINTRGDQTTVTFPTPQTFNRVLIQEPIKYGQRVKAFRLEALTEGHWVELHDELLEPGDSLTTIGYKRIICFPEVTAEKLRITITDSKCEPLISNISVYLAPPIVEPVEQLAGAEKFAETAKWRMRSPEGKYVPWADAILAMPLPSDGMVLSLGTNETFKGFVYYPDEEKKDGLILTYALYSSPDSKKWQKVAEGEFSNIVNNPYPQIVSLPETTARYIKFVPTSVNNDTPATFVDFRLLK